MPTYAPSFLSENQPKDLCFAKIKMKLIWGIQTTQGAEGAGAERRKLRGVSEFLKPGLGVGGWEARRTNLEEDKRRDGTSLITEASREQICWSQQLGTAVKDEFQWLDLQANMEQSSRLPHWLLVPLGIVLPSSTV
ncbi:hypothetical protein HGM15179_006516 [Zosterops borbonicus]|uniref:Uncharacterized protein n=1 Tax=Zosterops borbonicus TaxID=364589 RepID=A0A8K1GN11_9PASS|nr:hypothetical protein HGM15179_006516 [Zosterops borbonicus]